MPMTATSLVMVCTTKRTHATSVMRQLEVSQETWKNFHANVRCAGKYPAPALSMDNCLVDWRSNLRDQIRLRHRDLLGLHRRKLAFAFQNLSSTP
jgi:hypothetical protein